MSERMGRIVGTPTILLSLTVRMGCRCQKAVQYHHFRLDLGVDVPEMIEPEMIEPEMIEMDMRHQLRPPLSPESAYP